jgi:hypothetical protein
VLWNAHNGDTRKAIKKYLHFPMEMTGKKDREAMHNQKDGYP